MKDISLSFLLTLLALQTQYAGKELSCRSHRSQFYRPTLCLWRNFHPALFSSLLHQSIRYQQLSQSYRGQQWRIEGSASKRSFKEASGDSATIGRKEPSVGSVDSSGWLKVTVSTMETGGVEKHHTSLLKNGWTNLKCT